MANPTANKTTANTDLLNIGLMIVSFALAVQIPFTLFLFAYAILGPLHYLTEIFWLREHDYFFSGKKNALVLVLCATGITGIIVLNEFPLFRDNEVFRQILNPVVCAFYVAGITTSVAFIAIRSMRLRALIIVVSLVLAFVLRQQEMYLFLFGAFMGTIIHVSLFTLLFMLLGALKGKSMAGYLSVLVYLLCILGFAFVHINPKKYIVTQEVWDAYVGSGFHILNNVIGHLLDGAPMGTYDFSAKLAIRIQCFIAFVYLYHYLNWFSKVEVIKWNRVPRKVVRITIAIWLMAVLLYAYDYKAGLLALLLLSLIHVFLEFPLNYRSITGIAAEVKKRLA